MLISLNIQSQRHSLCALGCIYIPNISIVITLREGEGGGLRVGATYMQEPLSKPLYTQFIWPKRRIYIQITDCVIVS